jgi:hypothetical protein
MDVEYTTVKYVECLGEVDDYVYDISVKDADPYFFGNDILLHNTDSAYFSAFTVMKNQEGFSSYEWTKENVIDLYDKIAELTNESFAEFMMSAFGCSLESGKIIKAVRELCALKGLFITKKRYAVLIFDKEGKRRDQNGKPGEIKAMGLDLKRADTPKTVQDFLNEVLVKVLTGFTKEDTLTYISDFRRQFRSWEPWLKGSPKRVNNLTKYSNIQKLSNNSDISSNRHKDKKIMIPGHVLASINWNKLKIIYNDNYSMAINDGAKVIVCKLKLNPSGLTSVAYPVDQLTLPNWFRELPFDHDAMEEALIDKKIDNMISCLNWDLRGNKNDSSFGSLFKF